MQERLTISFIMLTVLIDAIGIGLILPVMPDLIREVQGGSIAGAAVWGGILATAFAAMQFLFGPLLGTLSDRYGRRPVLLGALALMALDYVIMALAGSIWLLLAGRIVGGITAGTQSSATAAIADISTGEQKAARFGLIGASFGVGFVLGPALGGLLAEYGTRAPFWTAAALSVANALFGYVVLRETVTDATRQPFRLTEANPLGALRAIRAFPGLAPLLWVYFLYQVSSVVYPAVWPYFTAERFGWSPGLIGASLAVYGGFFALVQAFLVRPAIRRFGTLRTVAMAMALDLACLVFAGFVRSGVLLMATIPIFALGAVGFPALQGIMSQAVADNRQGALQGLLASLNALAMIIAPVAMTQIFARFSEAHAPLYLPGAPFLLSALLMGGALALFLTRAPTGAARV